MDTEQIRGSAHGSVFQNLIGSGCLLGVLAVVAKPIHLFPSIKIHFVESLQ